ncbi:MAG: LysM peptidoglycan-binding domain-containing protein [Kiritimatiellia bacterium]
MNKFGMVLGLAAVATLAGCKDPDYRRGAAPTSQNEAKGADTTVATTIDADPVVVAKPACKCPPGTRHASPCACGAPDCKCIVEAKPVVVADISRPPEPAYTTYIVQPGDYLAKISKKFNVTISSIKRLNPSIKRDIVRVGQKLKLPGKIDVGAQPAPAPAASRAVSAGKGGFAPYTGATKEYVVKSGDTLGSVAYGSGINIRQLKQLNGLSSDSIRIGQKLKVPAEKVAAKKAAKPAAADKGRQTAAPVVASDRQPAEPVAAATAEKAPQPVADAEAAPAPVAAEEPVAAAEAPSRTYVVQEGDDMTGVSIRWGVSAAEIRELNNLAEGDQLVPGQVIKLPADAAQQ